MTLPQFSPHNTAFVFDFDGTLTQKYVHGQEVMSVISILRTENILNDIYSQEATTLKNIYHTIEVDPGIPFEIKYQKMNEWWQKHTELFIAHGLNREHICLAAYHPMLQIRQGVVEVFAFAQSHHIPTIIFSASGIGTDSIQFFLERHGINTPSVFIISNQLIYASDGRVTGVQEPLIHGLNKNEHVISQFPAIQSILQSKDTVVLLGDSPHDATMVTDMSVHKNIWRIGLLNDQDEVKKELLRPLFQEKFDVVIENDGSIISILDVFTQKKSVETWYNTE